MKTESWHLLLIKAWEDDKSKETKKELLDEIDKNYVSIVFWNTREVFYKGSDWLCNLQLMG